MSHIIFIFSFILLTVSSASSKTDKEVLIELKLFLQSHNKVNQGQYAQWNESDSSPCYWPGIVCNSIGRVTGINLRDSTISGPLYSNFSHLPELADLDLSSNTIEGPVPPELNQCLALRHLNLSHNLISGTLNLTGLARLETLDLTLNRFEGGIQHNFPALCASLVTLNVSLNNFTGNVDGCFDDCPNLKYVDLSSNRFSGKIWRGLEKLREVSIWQNNLTGSVAPETFTSECKLRELDLSGNGLQGVFPNSISNCSNLTVLSLWGNYFTGPIPPTIGSLRELTNLFLGNNSFDREIPEQILGCTKLVLLDLSRNNFGGEVQGIFGRMRTLQVLVLHSNRYTGGLESSGILDLPEVARLDLSLNNFSGRLPIKISEMTTLKILILAYNSFNGTIPEEYGNMTQLQALDLSFNGLSGKIPTTIGKLRSLLWLMLAENNLSGEIPSEIGNCTSLLWLNLENNGLSGVIPGEISGIGTDPGPTFEANRVNYASTAGSGECLTMRRWIPATYPPFRFVYTLLTRKSCRENWNRLLRGENIFPTCQNLTSPTRSMSISGYLQLSGNRLSGRIPPEIGKMKNMSLLQLNNNALSGELPSVIGDLPLMTMNLSRNDFSGKIPQAIGMMRCLVSLDLSYNNFSGEFSASLNQLTDLTIFNVSYNPLLSGAIPITGQIATFGNDSFIGDPLITISGGNRGMSPPPGVPEYRRRMPAAIAVAFLTFLSLIAVFLICGFLFYHISARSPVGPGPDSEVSTSASDSVKFFQLDRIPFTYMDIVAATKNFSDRMVIGRGGYGIVYRGTLPDGRHVAVKKLDTIGLEGEREFSAEMQALSCRPHPNLVVLFGWCLAGSEKLLVYDYMEGGSLDELITEWERFDWSRRLEVAIGVARALVFLHHECNPPVVHRDVKASNVLLDRSGRARVTDFGLARVVGPGESHVSTMAAGTVGYVAPEYGHTCKATTKGDVYSFGVLAMELATGRRALDGKEECLIEWARRVGVKEAVGSTVSGGDGGSVEGMVGMLGLMTLGMWCTAESPQMRPDMKEVLAMLFPLSRAYSSGSSCSTSTEDFVRFSA